ncbi:MAG: excisionase family DNA-binding protein [Acidimicrobiales bacterium]
MSTDELAVAVLTCLVERLLGPIGDRPWVTVEEASVWLGVGRSSGYEAVRRNELPSTRVGRRVVVPVPALVALLLGVPAHSDWLHQLVTAKANGVVRTNKQPNFDGMSHSEILTT